MGADGSPYTLVGGSPGNCKRRDATGRKSRVFSEADEYPSIFERCVSIKLEMMPRICYVVLDSRWGNSAAPFTADDRFATFERWEGGVAHLHSILWMRGLPGTYLVTGDEK